LTESQRLKYLKKAIEYGTKAIALGKEIKAMPMENEAAMNLMQAYKKLGNFKKSVEYAELYINTKDSMFSDEKTKALVEMGAKYEAEKKQLQLEKMQKQKELDRKTIEAQTAENRKQQIVILSTIVGLLIVFIFSIILFRMFRQKRRANILLAKQNTEIRHQKEEISVQRDEIEAQRDTVVKQNEHIEEQKKKIIDSITYAKRIQQAVLPSGDYSKEILGEHFILFKPKDIVSGDFYWGTRINEWLIVTVADCTGHGVPGAFMSMLGVSFLNEIVRKKEITKAGEVLDHLRKSIIEALKQKGQLGEQKDGMDIVFCALNTITNQLQFAGANNPLYIVKRLKVKGESEQKSTPQPINSSDYQLTEIMGDKQPVAIYERMTPFTNHEIQLEKGDVIYLISDGYQDQFGGPKNKKFMVKQLKQLFIDNCKLSMEEQRKTLDLSLENWKGENNQVDDITILGLKI
jgi:serine phosphatase RsbU (regulator of sigma subunit)